MENNLSSCIRSVIKKYRLNINLSQEQLADKAELDRTYISGFERGVRNITLQSLEKILNGLNLSETEFFNLCLKEYLENENV